MMNRLFYVFYPSLLGMLFGLIQTGLFFQLSFTLSSSFRTFLMVTICWLIGSAIGIQIARSIITRRWQMNILLLVALLAYYGCALFLRSAPFDTQLWPVYAVLIVVSGLYPGAFFVRMGAVYTARDLFFRENNGFIVGVMAGTILFMVLGRGILWVAPVILIGIILALPEPGFTTQQGKTILQT
jgi:uncharacterized membrane protein YoaK (UPF0700 family)